MKLTLTLPEVTKLVGKALGIPVETHLEVEVVTDTHVLAIALRKALTAYPDHRVSQKIAAIKNFRELAPRKYDAEHSIPQSSVSLMDAKFAVENSEVAFLNIGRYGRIQ
jgi:hypothetical protein